MECGRCLEVGDSPLVFLDCGHEIHERCRELVRSEGAKCPVSASCDGGAFMAEDESEADALNRLRAQHARPRTPPLCPDRFRRAEKLCVIPNCAHGTPFYYDGALHSYSTVDSPGFSTVSRFVDGELVASIRVKELKFVAGNGSHLFINHNLRMSKRGALSLGSTKEYWHFVNKVEGWKAARNKDKLKFDVLPSSPLIAQVNAVWEKEYLQRFAPELKSVELAIEYLEMRQSFRAAGLGALLRPLAYTPHQRVAPHLSEHPHTQVFTLSHSACLMLLERTCILKVDMAVYDLQIPAPDAWAIDRSGRLSVFVGGEGRVYSLYTGELLDVPANPNHYLDATTVLDRPGRVHLVRSRWCM